MRGRVMAAASGEVGSGSPGCLLNQLTVVCSPCVCLEQDTYCHKHFYSVMPYFLGLLIRTGFWGSCFFCPPHWHYHVVGYSKVQSKIFGRQKGNPEHSLWYSRPPSHITPSCHLSVFRSLSVVGCPGFLGVLQGRSREKWVNSILFRTRSLHEDSSNDLFLTMMMMINTIWSGPNFKILAKLLPMLYCKKL